MNNKKVSGLLEKFSNNKSLQKIIIILIAIIVFVVFIVSTFSNSETNSNESVQIEDYAKDLETRLANTLSQVEGVGEVAVTITIESGMETVLAMKTTTTETSNGIEITEAPVLVNGKTVVLKENYPRVLGVLIVAQGAKSIAVLTRIQQATVSLLDINVNQIEILTMK